MGDPSADPPGGATNGITMDALAAVLATHRIVPRALYDIGACGGQEAVALKRLYPEATVYAIEGLLENCSRWLVDAARETGIVVIPAVLAGQNGFAPFHVQSVNGIHSLYQRTSLVAVETRLMPTLTLDTLIDAYRLELPDVLKLDVEGAAFDILSSAPEALRHTRAIHLETETTQFFAGQTTHPHVAALLDGYGFSCVQEVTIPIADAAQLETVWIRRPYRSRL